MCYTEVGDRMEKKKSTTKSNKKGTSANTKKGTTSKTATTKKTTNSPAKKEVSKKVVETPKKVEKEENKVNMVKPVNNQKVEVNDEFAGNEIRKLLIIIGAVCAVMLSFYFITEFVIKNKKDDEKENKPKIDAVIQYDEILMGSSLNQGSGEYYVFAYLEDDTMLNVYNSYIEEYNKIDGHKKIYKVNLSNDFNKSYVSGTDEYYLEGKDASKIKVRGTTLIKVIDNEISYSYRNSETIIDKLTRLIG